MSTLRESGERLTSSETFGILGNETRLAILQALFEEKFGPPVSFSTLRKRIGMRDGSQFNYHLKKLEGPFIRKTDDGYQIRMAGIYVILAVIKGSFAEHPTLGPFETDGDCFACGGPLLAAYSVGGVFVRCASCEQMHTMGMIPPSAVLGRTEGEFLAAFNHRQRHDFELSRHGVCPNCAGRTTATLVRDAATMEMKLALDPRDRSLFEFGIRYQCQQCDVWEFGSPGYHLLSHPTVVDFHRDHGIDVPNVPYWELEWVITTEGTTIRSDDPFVVAVEISLADETLTATLDEAFEVTSLERQARAGCGRGAE